MAKPKLFVNNEADIQVITDGTPATIYSYKNGKDNFLHREARTYAEAFDPHFLKAKLNARSLSEGQSILYSVLDLVNNLKPNSGAFFTENAHTIILLDEIDSGLSIDNIDTIMRKLKYALRHRNDLQIFLSFNSPRILKHHQEVISLYDGSVLNMRTDDDMLREIKAHKVQFDRHKKTSQGYPRIVL